MVIYRIQNLIYHLGKVYLYPNVWEVGISSVWIGSIMLCMLKDFGGVFLEMISYTNITCYFSYFILLPTTNIFVEAT